MKRNEQLYLQDILESCISIEKYVSKTSLKQFISDPLRQDAIIRRLEIIGEAVKNIHKDTKDKYPRIPWKKIAGMRDIIAHEYFGVDIIRVWKITQKRVPKLRKEVSKILSETRKK